MLKKILSIGLLIIICITHLNLLDGFSPLKSKGNTEKSKSMSDFDDENEQEKEESKGKDKSDIEKDEFVVVEHTRYAYSCNILSELLFKSNTDFSSQRVINENFRPPCC